MVRRLPIVTWLVLAVAIGVAWPRATAAQAPSSPSLPPTPPGGGARPGGAPPAPDALPPADPVPLPARVPAEMPFPPDEAKDPAPKPTAPTRPRVDHETPRDDRARTASEVAEPADGDDKGPLPGARPKPNAPPPAADADGGPKDAYDVEAERLPLGKQVAGLSVEVVAPGVMNKGQSAMLKIVVRNTGTADLSTVRVHYDLPKELELLTSQPEFKQVTKDEPKFYWMLNTLAAGSEQMIALKVKAVGVNIVDHATHVTVSVGGRSRTVIQEPLLKVEQSVTPKKVLKGQQVNFRIAVSNPGSGPARNVLIQARLSSGLKADREEIVEQTIPILQPKERVELEALVVDTVAGGEQSSVVTATSPDVLADAKFESKVVVLKPELALGLAGPETRPTDTTGDYLVTVTNPGSADAKDVKVVVTLPPGSGRLQQKPADAEWNPKTQKLTWIIPNVAAARGGEPGKVAKSFRIGFAGIGMYRVVAEAKAPGGLSATGALSTDVTGMADVEFDVSVRKRVMDVGEFAIFDIRMKNVGTKAAKNLLVRAQLSKNLEAVDTAGIEERAPFDAMRGEVTFPKIDSLAPNRELELSIKVKATKPGAASCRAFLMHDDLTEPDAGLEDMANTRVMGNSQRR